MCIWDCFLIINDGLGGQRRVSVLFASAGCDGYQLTDYGVIFNPSRPGTATGTVAVCLLH